MTSLVPCFNYSDFIKYPLKDNSYDHWLALKKLASKNLIFSSKIIGISLLFLSFSFNSVAQEDYGTVKDFDGNEYKTVKIGKQIWMAENLKTIYYNNGDSINDGTGKVNITSENNPTYYFNYADSIKYAESYGRLYTGFTVTEERNICPIGWRIPTVGDYVILGTYLLKKAGKKSQPEINENALLKIMFFTYKDIGGNMKEVDTVFWNNPNVGADNVSGFTGLPGGKRSRTGNFQFKGEQGYWWSSARKKTSEIIWVQTLSNKTADFIQGNTGNKSDGYSVRCLKD